MAGNHCAEVAEVPRADVRLVEIDFGDGDVRLLAERLKTDVLAAGYGVVFSNHPSKPSRQSCSITKQPEEFGPLLASKATLRRSSSRGDWVDQSSGNSRPVSAGAAIMPLNTPQVSSNGRANYFSARRLGVPSLGRSPVNYRVVAAIARLVGLSTRFAYACFLQTLSGQASSRQTHFA